MEPPGKNGGRAALGQRDWEKKGVFSLWFGKWRNLVISVRADAIGERWGPRDGCTMPGGGRRQ